MLPRVPWGGPYKLSKGVLFFFSLFFKGKDFLYPLFGKDKAFLYLWKTTIKIFFNFVFQSKGKLTALSETDWCSIVVSFSILQDQQNDIRFSLRRKLLLDLVRRKTTPSNTLLHSNFSTFVYQDVRSRVLWKSRMRVVFWCWKRVVFSCVKCSMVSCPSDEVKVRVMFVHCRDRHSGENSHSNIRLDECSLPWKCKIIFHSNPSLLVSESSRTVRMRVLSAVSISTMDKHHPHLHFIQRTSDFPRWLNSSTCAPKQIRKTNRENTAPFSTGKCTVFRLSFQICFDSWRKLD